MNPEYFFGEFIGSCLFLHAADNIDGEFFDMSEKSTLWRENEEINDNICFPIFFSHKKKQ